MSALTMVCAVVLASTAFLSGCNKSATVESEGNKALTVTVPASVSVVAGDTEKVKIAVNRKNFDGAVDVEIGNLPEGVTVKDAKVQLAKGESDFELVLIADGKAKVLSNHAAKVTATNGDVSVTETVKVTVREKE